MTDSAYHNGGLIWITGYSGAGKTTVAKIVSLKLKERGYPVLLLDGDELRSILGEKYGHGIDDRKQLACVYSRLCKKISDSGITVVIATLAMFESVRMENRESNSNYLEVYLEVPFHVRAARDPKGIYLAASKKTEASYSSAGLEEPRNPDLIIRNFGEVTPEVAATEIAEKYINQDSRNVTGTECVTTIKGNNYQYWDGYYKKRIAPINPSSFAFFCNENFLDMHCHILEFGCGNGRDTFYFSKRHRITGVDTSSVAIQTNQKRAMAEGILNIDFIAGEFGTEIPGLPYVVDAVYGRFVLHAMPLDAEIRVLNASWELLKNGGRLFLEFRTDKDPLMKNGVYVSRNERFTNHYRRFINFADVCDRISKAGFLITYCTEKKGLATHGDDDPFIGRIIAGRQL
jgi:adenylylsulfate kinase-like enzyme/SAM-dependent methyltransferase